MELMRPEEIKQTHYLNFPSYENTLKFSSWIMGAKHLESINIICLYVGILPLAIIKELYVSENLSTSSPGSIAYAQAY